MTQRIHYSREPLTEIRTVSPVVERTYAIGKPNGLWYEVDGSWKKFCVGETKSTKAWIKGTKAYELDVDVTKILRIQSLEELRKFEAEYAAPAPWKAPSSPTSIFSRAYINWEAVGRQWGGIEIAPYQWEARLTSMWYYGWDVASGCVWDATAINEFKEIQHGNVRRDKQQGRRLAQSEG